MPMNNILEYNPETEEWQEIGVMTEARVYHAASVVSYKDFADWCEYKCINEWTYFAHTKRCYRYYTTMKDWQGALNFCKSETAKWMDANLVSIPDKTTNDFLLNTMTNTEFWTEIWTGGSIQNGQWVWSDGSEWTGWTNWSNGNPSGGSEDHLEFYGQTGQWNDGQQSYQRRILCQYDPSN